MKKNKILSLFLSIFVMISSFVGCSGNGYPVNIGGAEITQPPKTVAVFSEQAGSAIYALGYKSYLVGAPTEFIESHKPKGVTDIGAKDFIDYEKLQKLKPDVVIVSGDLTDSNMESLKLRDIKVVLLRTPTKYSEVAPYYEAISKLFLGEKKYTEAYDAFIGENEKQMELMKKQNSTISKKVVVFVEEAFPTTGDTLPGQALTKIGIKNIAQNAKDYMMSADEIIAADPEVIFCPKDSSESILANETYKDITAIKKGAVYEIDIPALTFAGEGFISTLQDMTNYLSKLK